MKQAKRVPKSAEERQTKMVKTYLNKSEYEQFKKNKGGMTESRFLRMSALNQMPSVNVDDLLVRELARVGGNLNQIARNTNRSKQVDMSVLEQLKGLENELKNALEQIVENAKNGGKKNGG